jgi:hypothetical protein
MKLGISILTAAGFSLTCTALADHYKDLAAQGYRWVTVNGPYACQTEQDLQRIVAHRTDATELEAVQNIQCYYLIPGTVVQVIDEDPARSMSKIRLGSIIKSLWTYNRFLSKQPVQDTYGNIETPEECGLIPRAEAAVTPLPLDSSTTRTQSNGTP